MATKPNPVMSDDERNFKYLRDERFLEARQLAAFAFERTHYGRHFDNLNPQFKSHLTQITFWTLEALRDLQNNQTGENHGEQLGQNDPERRNHHTA